MSIVETVIVDSKNRSTGTPSSFEFAMPFAISNVENIIPESATIQHTEFTINEYNNKFHFQHTDGTNHTLTIDLGFYSAAELTKSLTVLMNGEVEYEDIYTENNEENKLDISKCYYWLSVNSLTKLIEIGFGDLGTGSFSLFFDTSYSIESLIVKNSVGFTLGFEKINYFSIESVVAPYSPHLSTEYYDIRVENLIRNRTYNHSGSFYSLFVLDQLEEDNSLNYQQSTYPVKYFPTSSVLNRFSINVYNDMNLPAILKKDWVFKFKVVRKV